MGLRDMFRVYDTLNVWDCHLGIENLCGGVGRIRNVGGCGSDSQWDKGHAEMKPTFVALDTCHSATQHNHHLLASS
jgi:hypothetical protein